MKSRGIGDTEHITKFFVALAAGCVMGWLWATKPAVLNSVKWLEVLTAVGTVGAAGVAGWLGVRDGFRRRQDEKRRAIYAQQALWPEFRKYLHAISELQRETKRTAPTLTLAARLDVQSWVREMVLHLRDTDLERAARVLAHLQHAHRHLIELYGVKGEYPNGRYKAKVYAARDAIADARRLIVPLVDRWRRE